MARAAASSSSPPREPGGLPPTHPRAGRVCGRPTAAGLRVRRGRAGGTERLVIIGSPNRRPLWQPFSEPATDTSGQPSGEARLLAVERAPFPEPAADTSSARSGGARFAALARPPGRGDHRGEQERHSLWRTPA